MDSGRWIMHTEIQLSRRHLQSLGEETFDFMGQLLWQIFWPNTVEVAGAVHELLRMLSASEQVSRNRGRGEGEADTR